jgi:hypothetical protein
MLDREGCDRFRGCEADVDGGPAAALLDGNSAPADDIAASRAEMDFDGGLGVVGADIDAGGTGDSNAFVFLVIRPEHAVAAAEGAVAGGDQAGIAFKGPGDGTAVAGAGERVGHWDCP